MIRENFYCKDNAKILEDLLKKESISISKLSTILCPIIWHSTQGVPEFEETANLEILQRRFLKYKNQLDCIINNHTITRKTCKHVAHGNCIDQKPIELQHKLKQLCFSLLDPRNKDNVTKNTLIRPSYIITLLIENGHLPETLYRLPRNLNLAIESRALPLAAFNKCIATYYEQYSDKYLPLKESDHEILEQFIHLPINYSEDLPALWTYKELKKRWSSQTNIDVLSQCLKGHLGAYIKVSGHFSSSDYYCRSLYTPNTDINTLATYNCGNPFYKKRYNGLERIILIDVENLSVTGKIKQNAEILFPLQTTDFETKFHIERRLHSRKDYIEINLDHLCFVKEEVIAIEENNRRTKIKTNNNLTNSASVAIAEKNHDDTNVHEKFIWNDFYNRTNGKIIEDLLDRDSVSLNELFNLFFSKTTQAKIDNINFNPLDVDLQKIIQTVRES